jgi:hypothetical protein
MIPNWLVWLDWLQLHRSYHGGQASPDSSQISGVDIQAAPTDQGQGGFGPQLSLSCNSSRKRHCRQLEDESIDRRDIGSAES